MDLDHASLLRLQEFVTSVNRTMNALPLPVPPWPGDAWDGDRLLVREFYLAYSRLPEELQEAAAYGYARCLDALQAQSCTALDAQMARYAVFADLSRRAGLTPDEMCPDLRNRGERPYLTLVRDPHEPDEPDEHDVPADDDEALRHSVLATVAAYTGGALTPDEPDDPSAADPMPADAMPADAADPMPADAMPADAADPMAADAADDVAASPSLPTGAAVEPVIAEAAPVSCRVPVIVGAALALAAAALALVAWPRSAGTPTPTDAPARPAAPLACMAEPPPLPFAPATDAADGPTGAATSSAFTVDRTASDGDFTVIVSHGERVGVRTRYHVHMVNADEQPRHADITVHHGDRDTSEPPEVIPPHSSRSRVIEIVDSEGEAVYVSVGGIRVENLLIEQ